MPKIVSRGNYAGLDTRPGYADSSLNSAADLLNIDFTEKSIRSRDGHRALHSAQVPKGALLFDDTSYRLPTVYGSIINWNNVDPINNWAVSYSWEVVFNLETFPAVGNTREVLNGIVGVRITAAGSIDVGVDSGAGTVWWNTGLNIVAGQSCWIRCIYESAVAGGQITVVSSVGNTAIGGLGALGLDMTKNLVFGSTNIAATTPGNLVMCNVSMWPTAVSTTPMSNTTRSQYQYFDNQLPTLHWRLDEGSGYIAEMCNPTTRSFLLTNPTDADLHLGNDPTSDGIVDGSIGAVWNYDNEHFFVWGNCHGSADEVGAAGSNGASLIWKDADQCWAFNLRFDLLPGNTGAGAPAYDYYIMELGYNAPALTGTRVIVEKRAGVAGLWLALEHDNGGPIIRVRTLAAISAGVTYDVIADFDQNGANTTLRLYLDGVLQGSNAIVAVATPALNTFSYRLIRLAKSADNGPIDYKVDDLRIYNDDYFGGTVNINQDIALGASELANTQLLVYVPFDAANNRSMFFNFVTRPKVAADVSAKNFGFDNTQRAKWTGAAVLLDILVAPVDAVVRGAHHYLDASSGSSQELVHGRGNVYTIGGGLLRARGPETMQGALLVDSVRYGRNGTNSYFLDGDTEVLRYDGSNVYKAGIQAPHFLPEFLSAGAGPNYAVGFYYIAYSYIAKGRDGRQIESPLSPIRRINIAGAPAPIQIGGVLCDDPQVDRIQLYISKTDGTTLFRANSIDNVTGLRDVLVAETDLFDFAPLTREPPLRFRYAVERDGRMVYAGADEAPRSVFVSEVDFPEYVSPLNFRTVEQEVTGLAVMPNNELVIFGRNSRTVIAGDFLDLRTRTRQYRDGGCLSHYSLSNVGNWVNGLGPDGPFRCNGQIQQSIDEVYFNGQVYGSIRELLNIVTDRTYWAWAVSTYDWDRKTWYLAIPKDTSGRMSLFTYQADISAWSRWTDLSPGGALEFVNYFGTSVIGCAGNGIMCRFLNNTTVSGAQSDIVNAERVYGSIASKPTTNGATFTALGPSGFIAPTAGIDVWKYDKDAGTVAYVCRADYYDTPSGVLYGDFTGVNVNDEVLLGTYPAYYRTKSLDARTTTERLKCWRYFQTHHAKYTIPVTTYSDGLLHLLFEKLGGENTLDFASTTKHGYIDLTADSQGRFGPNVSSERIMVSFGRIDTTPVEIHSWDIDFDQFGIM